MKRNFAVQQTLGMAGKAQGRAPTPTKAQTTSISPEKDGTAATDDSIEAERLGLSPPVFQLMKTYFAQGINVVFLADDSGSMSSVVSGGPGKQAKTRWDELKETFRLVCDIVGHFDSDGFDLRFLNRPGAANVKTMSQIEQLFQRPPSGSTNLIDAMEAIYESPLCQPEQTNKKLLLIVMTDGLPDGNISRRRKMPGDLAGVMALVQNQHSLRGWEEKYYCSFVLCTEDDGVVEQYNAYDNKIPNFDVIDDYESERREIIRHRGKQFPFDKREYVAKIILGSMDAYYDNMDEAGSYFSDGGKLAGITAALSPKSSQWLQVLAIAIGLFALRWLIFVLFRV